MLLRATMGAAVLVASTILLQPVSAKADGFQYYKPAHRHHYVKHHYVAPVHVEHHTRSICLLDWFRDRLASHEHVQAYAPVHHVSYVPVHHVSYVPVHHAHYAPVHHAHYAPKHVHVHKVLVKKHVHVEKVYAPLK